MALKTRDIEKLDRFHRDTLRQFQSLPKRAAIPSVYLLLGALPIEAELHKRQFSFLYILLSAENVKLKRIIERQLCVNFDNKDSFFYCIVEVLSMYLTLPLDIYNHYWSTTHTCVEQFSHHRACVPVAAIM